MPTFDLFGYGLSTDRFWKDGFIAAEETITRTDERGGFTPTKKVIKLFPSYTIIEFEGFKCSTKPLLVKELAWFNIGTKHGGNLIFKFSQAEMNNLDENDWNQYTFYTKHIHGVPFLFGNTDYKCLSVVIDIIKSHSHVLVTKGAEKARILRDMFNMPVVDVGERPVPSYHKLATRFPIPPSFWCKFHKKQIPKKPHCSSMKINVLLSWMLSRNIAKKNDNRKKL